MSDINHVNISLLKTYKSDFDHEKSNFKNSAYRTFSSSYLKNCGDATIKKMSSKIDALYKKIDTGYNNIDRWWGDYNQNVEELEKTLSNPGNGSRIKESSLRNYVNTNLKELKEIKLDFATILTLKTGSYNKVAFSNNQAVSKIGQFQDLYGDYNVKDVNVQSVSKNQNVKGRMGNVDTSAEGSIAAWKEKIFIPLKKSLQEVGAYVGTGEGKVKKNILEIGKQIALRNATPEQAAAIEVKAAWNQMRNILEQSQEEEGHWYDWAVDGYNYLADGVSEVWNVTTGAVEYVWDDIVEEWEILKEGFGIMGDQLVEGFERLNATITTFALSGLEGIGNLVENVFSGGIILGAVAISSNITVPVDILKGCFTGNWDFEITGQLWDRTRSTVENIDFVTPVFDSFYDNTKTGQYLKEKTYGFDTVRSVGCGVGEMGGTIALSVLTGGSFSVLTSTAAVKGLGSGTKTAWQEGAGTLEGLTYGVVNGAWEGAQYYIGAKVIGQYDAIKNPLGGNLTNSQKVSNALTRIKWDSIDGGAEGFVQPMMKMIYQKGYYDDNGNYIEFTDQNLFERYGELFDDNGGFNSVLSNAIIGGIGSTGGELWDLRKYFKQTNAEIDVKTDVSMAKESIDKKIESNVDANMKKMNSFEIKKEDLFMGNDKILSHWKEIDNITEYVSKYQDQIFLKITLGENILYKDMYAKIAADELTLKSLTDSNLMRLNGRLDKNIDNSLLLKEIETRIDNGHVLVDHHAIDDSLKMGVITNEFGHSVECLPENLFNKLKNNVQGMFKMSTPEIDGLKLSNNFQELSLIRMMNSENFDRNAYNTLIELSKNNKDLLNDFNFELLDKNIVDQLGADYVIEIGKYGRLGDSLLSLYNNNSNAFHAFSNLIKDCSMDDSLGLFYTKSKNYLNFFFENQDILNDIDPNSLNSKSLLDYIIYHQNKDGVLSKRIELDYSDDYQVKFAKKCDEMFDDNLASYNQHTAPTLLANDIQGMQEAYCQKYFSISRYEAEKLVDAYGTNIDSVAKYDLEQKYVPHLMQLKTALELDDVDALTKLYNNQKFSFSPLETLYFSEGNKKLYFQTYTEELGKTSTIIKDQIKNNNYTMIKYNNKDIPVVKIDDDFSFLVHSSDTGFVGDKTLINGSYIDTWNSLKYSKTHGLSTSYISSDYLGNAPVRNTGVLYAFNDIDTKNLFDVSPYDLNSNIADYGFSSNNRQVYVTAQNMPSSSTRVYNEVVLDRTAVKPSCVIIYDDMTDDLVNNALHAASEWDIPVVKIDKTNLVQNQVKNINNLLDQFTETKDVNALKKAIETYETNASGHKLNGIENLNDKTTDINNQSYAELFSPDRIKNTMDDYLNQLEVNPNKNDAMSLKNTLESIQNKYDIANKNGSFAITQTYSKIGLDNYIKQLENIIAKGN